MSKEKISSHEIVELLAEQAGITKKLADEFLRSMFSTIEDALIAGEPVKVKKFGTFKLQRNEPRKSVNVQTGEDIIIPGYYKVNFVPDNSLKDAVNEPFSHLDSVSMDEKIEPEQAPITEGAYDQMGIFAEQANEIKDILSEIKSLSEEKHSEKLESNELELPTPELESADSEDEIVEHITVPVEEPELVVETTNANEVEPVAVEPELIENKVIGSDYIEKSTTIEENAAERVIVNNTTPPIIIEPPLLQTQEYGSKKRRKSKVWWVILILLFIIITAGVSSYYTSTCVKCWVTYDLLSESNRHKLDNYKTKFVGWFSFNKKAEPVSLEIVKADTIAAIPVVEQAVDSLQQLFDTERVYTELLGTERITKGSSLTRFSLRYYGHREYWVYIYEANKSRIADPNNIKIGTLIKVPKIDMRLIDTNNPRTFEQAKKLHDMYVK